MNYSEIKQIFQDLKRNMPKENLTTQVVFTEDSFFEPYSLLSRTYRFSSDNKAFMPNMGGYSIFASCLDGTDQRMRLDWHMAEEGNPGGWKVADCYILEQMQDVTAIPALARLRLMDGTICCHFGDTCIHVREFREGGEIRLEPLDGNQTTDGKLEILPIDRVYGYSALLERHLNDMDGRIVCVPLEADKI